MSIFFDKLENLQSLSQISTQYSVFEEGQVLTSGQLNSLTQYLDDQIRLTRVGLIGVGIAGGLNVSIVTGGPNVRIPDHVLLTRGAGVNSDGDVLWIPEDLRFDRFKSYADTAPYYGPFHRLIAPEGGFGSVETRIRLYELVPRGVEDSRATPLSAFEGDLSAMVAVLLMESYVKDDDLCSGTDCDNLGRDSVNVVKLLLTDYASAGQLAEGLVTPDSAARGLNEIVANRPLLSKVNNVDTLATEYRAACNSIHGKLTAALTNLYPACAPLIDDLFPSDPAPEWNAKLEAIKATASQDASIQYYYDFLKDLAETHNAFRGAMFGITAVRCPEVRAFPKHLLLGNLGAKPDSMVNRTGFYPSPNTGAMAEQWSHARFLLRKLGTLIDTFQIPGNGPIRFTPILEEDRSLVAERPALFLRLPVRITPSQGEDRSLEERAIPFYYRFDGATPIHRSWSWELERRGMSAWNYSYRANEYDGQGGAADPFAFQIGRFPFFRIEGHLGSNVERVESALKSQIEKANLPIAVRSVLLGSDKKRIIKRPRPYTDLHHMHDLLRREGVQQLDDAAHFSESFKTKVDQAVGGESDGPALRTFAERNHATVTARASAAKTKLNQKFSDFASDTSWREDVKEVMQASGEFKSDLGRVVRTEFATPFDTVISSSPLQWVDWLGDIIQTKAEKQDEKLLFTNFLREHPGAEHFAGVARGGTLILVYDSESNVVADFMLPYRWVETVEEEPATPLPPKPSIKPAWLVDNGIKIQPSRETFVEGFVEGFVTPKLSGLRTELKPTSDLQSQVFNILSSSLTQMTDAATRPRTITGLSPLQPVVPPLVPGNEFLHLQLQETQIRADKLDFLRRKVEEPGADTVTLNSQIKEIELELAKSIDATAGYIATSGIDVKAGSEGFTAVLTVSNLATRLSSEEAVTAANDGFVRARETAVQPELKTMINVVLREES